ncbi:MAG TPA: hypothetical protein VGA37_01735 [Gemmatimonadales bacterium]
MSPIWSRVSTAISSVAGLLPDRRVLERTIFPFLLARQQFHSILFVGCRWYTRPYTRTFRDAGKAYWTIDVDPAQRRHGAGARHIVDGLEQVAHHFDPGALDAIICNGVFGWGLDARESVDQALAGSFQCLRDGGLLIVGWNETDRRSNGAAGMYAGNWAEQSATLRRFERYQFPGLETWRYHAGGPTRHVFDFFSKPDSVTV